MGKKSRRNKGSNGSATGQSSQQEQATAATTAGAAPAAPPSPQQEHEQLTAQQAIHYASDGPSDVELLQTTSPTLQLKLDQLVSLAQSNNRQSFVAQFVPLDLPPGDAQGYLEDLTTAPEAEGQWRNLVAEIAAIRCGRGVDRIEGDQVSRAMFYFRHPLLEACDREVGFVCVNGEWRAEG